MFSPAARVRSPDGTDWEIYVVKLRLRERLTDPDDPQLGWGNTNTTDGLVLEALLAVLVYLPLVCLRFLFDLAAALVRLPFAKEWTVEAVNFVPARQSYLWRADKAYRRDVVEGVRAALAEGRVPRQLEHARFVGWQRPAAT